MSLPAIGSLARAGRIGPSGVVVGAQPLGEPRDGRQLVALTIKYREDEATAGGAAPSGARRAPERILPGSGSDGDPTRRPGPAARDGRGAAAAAPAAARSYEDLSAEERAVVDRMRQRDQQVRQEEKAHAGVAGDLAGPIHYIYQRGPDGRLYAVGGSVPIESRLTSGDPEEARRLGARLAAAAHAATNPSGADLASARQGYALQNQDGPPRGTALDVSA